MGNPNPPNKWKKGQSGNPKGRPKKVFNYADELRVQLIAVDPKDERGRTYGQIIVAKQIELAKMGSVRATNEILDRLLGKPPQAVAIADMRTQSRDDELAEIVNSLKVLRQLEESERADSEPPVQ
jgi:predicted ArsR family transcriptional regulator